MNILVCISNVPDTTTRIKYTTDQKEVDYSGVQWIINPWDELALTRAIELKEANPALIQKITAITVGKADAEPTLRKALACGADDAIRVDASGVDSFYTASQLTNAIKDESFDLILCGIESSDFNGAAVGGMLAELLDWPSVSAVSSVNIENESVKVTREIDGGKQLMETGTPSVLIVQKGIALNPRIPSMRGIMTARTKQLKVVPAVEAAAQSHILTFAAPPQKSACKIIDAENLDELARLLHTEARVI
ncbi:MAG: electron transfer flavoprotein subunit beta/FixA family protein [Lentimicrobium sp.]|nr:electron transfer flavoprotein subunit beta/FixA family protein [Lentimicrobium sp.]